MSSKSDDILKDWEWIETNLMPTLVNFENESDVTNFIRCKIESLVQVVADQFTENINVTKDVNSNISKFTKLFGMPPEEKLVNCNYNNLFYCFCIIIIIFIFQIIRVAISKESFHDKAGFISV